MIDINETNETKNKQKLFRLFRFCISFFPSSSLYHATSL